MGPLSPNGQGIYHLMGGALWYGWGTYGLNGWGSYDKVSCCFVWKYAQKIAGLHMLSQNIDHPPCFGDIMLHFNLLL